MTIEPHIALLELLLAPWEGELGADYLAYKNHLYRMVHFCLALYPCSDEQRQKVIIAACFHDLGIWSEGTVDYLPPSVALAQEYLAKKKLKPWIEEISLMIDMHHKVRAFTDARYPLVEAFRKADLVDVSLGAVSFGLPRAYIRRVRAQFPNAGFHQRLGQLAGQWFSKHPLTPPPFLKW